MLNEIKDLAKSIAKKEGPKLISAIAEDYYNYCQSKEDYDYVDNHVTYIINTLKFSWKKGELALGRPLTEEEESIFMEEYKKELLRHC